MTTTDDLKRPGSRPGILPALCFLAAVLSCAVGIPEWMMGACPSCRGLLSLVLPWAGAAFYSWLAILAWRSPDSPQIPHALSLAVFVHGCLVVEMLLLGRLCIGCLSIAGLAFGAAGFRAWRTPPSRLTLLAGVVLGALAGLLTPFDHVEDTLTRRFWPAHILGQAPAFVDRAELAACDHQTPVRLFTYEDERACQGCSGLGRRIIPQLNREFPFELCVHKHIIPQPSPGQVLPVLVFLSRTNRLIVCEGVPDQGELNGLLRDLIRECGGPPPPKRN